MDFVKFLVFNEIMVEIQQSLDTKLAVVFGRFGVNRHNEVAMGTQTEVVREAPMEKHGWIDERAAVKVKDELALWAAFWLAWVPRCPK